MKEIRFKLQDGVKADISAKVEDGYLVVCYEPDMRWRAKEGEKYYIINLFNNKIEEQSECNVGVDNDLYDCGNYFRTREEAEDAKNKIAKILCSHKG
jgi:hypothetical protein